MTPTAAAATRALLTFHLRTGARLAMQVMAPALAVAGGAMVVVADGFPTAFVRMLFGDAASGNARPLLVLPALAFASSAAPRVCRGLEGWMRHLPVAGRSQRRAAMLAVAVAEVPLLLGLALLAWIAFHGWSAFFADLAGLALCAPAVALAVMPVERRAGALPLSLAAALLAVSGGWPAVLFAALVLLAADAVAGPLRSIPGRRVHGHAHGGGASTSPLALAVRIAWRAAGGSFVTVLLTGLIPLAATTLFLANNTLTAEQAGLAVRFGGGAAVVALCASLGEVMAARRPVWPWSRSLPSSSRRRVAADAVILGVPALALVVLAARLDARAVAPLAALVPFVAIRSAGAIRRAPERRTGASGEIAIEGGLLAGAVAVQPWLAILPLLAVPWAVRAAAERERAQKVSRWLERHHLAAGDPLSWSA